MVTLLLALLSVVSIISKKGQQFEWGLIIKLTVQKMKFSIKDFFNKCDQIRRKLRIWSRLPKKSLMENVIFCAVTTRPKNKNKIN